MQPTDDMPARNARDVARAEARLSGRTAACFRSRSGWRCSRLCPTRSGLWLKLLADGVMRGTSRLALCGGPRAGRVGGSDVVSACDQRSHAAPIPRPRRPSRSNPTWRNCKPPSSPIAHQERPDYLDRLAMLRDQVFVLDHMYMSLFSTCGWILRLARHGAAADFDSSSARRCWLSLPCRPC